MTVLCLDTATDDVSVALGRGGAVLGDVRLRAPRRHAEVLVPTIEFLFRRTGVELAQVGAIAVGIGPGLFTGLRVGVTTAKSLAQVLNVPVVGVPSLDLIAYPLRYGHALVAAVIDARRGEVFYALYRPVPGGLQRVSDYEVGSPRELVAELGAQSGEVMLAGGGALLYRRELAELEHAMIAGPAHAAPDARALVELAEARVEREEFSPLWDVHPLYGRRSDAEINRERGRL